MVLSQVKSIRETFAKVISDKHEDVMAKFGAILAQGIIDAGMLLISLDNLVFSCN